MASNDPTDTGGLFIGRRPGTGPLRYREQPKGVTEGRRRRDALLANAILVVETLLLATLWGPQPIAWLWVGSQVDYQTGEVAAGIMAAFTGMLFTLFLSLAVAVRLDRAWRLVRRAAGYEQQKGIIERIFVISLMIGGTAFLLWFMVLNGPGSSVFSGQTD